MTIKRISLDGIQDAIDAGTVILVPNNRLRDAVLQAYGDSRDCLVYQTPTVLGIDIWVRETWDKAAREGLSPYCDRRPITTTEETFLWTEIIEASQDNYPLLNPEETANVVSRAYQTAKHWQLEESHQEVLQAYSVIPDIRVFMEWCQVFERQCLERQVISLADCLQQINHDLREGLPLPVAESFLLLNFYDPPPLYAALFENLSDRGTVSRVNRFTQSKEPPGAHHEFPTQEAEFLHCALWVKSLVEKAPQAHIGIVGELDENQKDALLHTLATVLNPDQVIELSTPQAWVNTTHSSHNLIQEGMIFDAFLLLGLLRAEQKSEDICRLLRSPFLVACAEEREQRNQLERHMRRYFSDRCLPSELSHLMTKEDKDYHCPILASALLSLRERSRRLDTKLSPGAWADFFSQLLSDFEWPGTNLTRYQQQLLKQWQEALGQLANLSPVLGRIDSIKALSCLRNLCSRANHSQQFDASRQLSLYSIDEAVGLEFDHLWLLNFNDQVWPPSISPSPFLPYSLQKELRLPGSHSDIQHARAQASFQILCNSVSAPLISSHHRSDGDQDYRASAFSGQLGDIQKNQDESLASQTHGFYGTRFRQDYLLLTIEDASQVPLPRSDASLGGHQVLSDQSSCPFRAFALHRLQAEPLEAFSSGLNRMARGSAMHRAVEVLMQKIPSDKDLRMLDAAAIEQYCDEAAREASNFLQHRYPAVMTPRFERIERKRSKQLLQRFLTGAEAEAGREPFRVIGREERLHWQFEDMHFNLVIDRIDELADGRLAVIDYKTGKTAPSSSSWLAERPEDLQIPFYYTVMSETWSAPVAAVAIAHLNAARIGYSGLPADQGFHRKLRPTETDTSIRTAWPELTTLFTSRIKAFAMEFRAGVSRVDPANDTNTCNYCQLGSLCRIDEIAASLSRRDGGED